jgi:glycosidase
MPWGDVEWRNPWLPVGGGVASVVEQRSDPASVLSFSRDVIALRRAREDLVSGAYAPLASGGGVWAWRRGDATAVVLNLTDVQAAVPFRGTVLLSTRGRDDSSRLEPWEGVVLALS